MVYYSISIDPIVVSVIVFEIFDSNCNDLELRGFKVDPRSQVMVPIESPLVVCFLIYIGSSVVSRTVFEIFDAKIVT